MAEVSAVSNVYWPEQVQSRHAFSEQLVVGAGKTVLFLSFPYVCPEPVLVTCSFLNAYMAQNYRFYSPAVSLARLVLLECGGG